MDTNDMQQSIQSAAKRIADATTARKAVLDSLKELKKTLKEKLAGDAEYQSLQKRKKEITDIRKDLTEELKEIKKSMEQMAMETDEYKEIEDYTDDSETTFITERDKAIAQLSRDLADLGITAEIAYKSGQLMLIVARN